MVHLLQCSSSVHHMPFFLLLLTSSMEAVAFSDASRRLPLTRQAVAAEPGAGEAIAAAKELAMAKQQQLVRKAGNGRALIGSRPPRCERACLSCGHCEAVQVPIVPQMKRPAVATDDDAATTTVTAAMFRFRYRVDGIANYKPLSWKCRCGGTILDP